MTEKEILELEAIRVDVDADKEWGFDESFYYYIIEFGAFNLTSNDNLELEKDGEWFMIVCDDYDIKLFDVQDVIDLIRIIEKNAPYSRKWIY